MHQEGRGLNMWDWRGEKGYRNGTPWRVKALFSSQKILQNFSDSPSHRIFRCMHGVLNIDENKN